LIGKVEIAALLEEIKYFRGKALEREDSMIFSQSFLHYSAMIILADFMVILQKRYEIFWKNTLNVLTGMHFCKTLRKSLNGRCPLKKSFKSLATGFSALFKKVTSLI
jgi:hypothetical protein